MIFEAIIEIPRGDDRRRHFNCEKNMFVDLDPIKERIPVNEGVMPIHYGFIPNTHNPADKDDVDLLLYSEREFKVGEKVKVRLIGLLDRADGDSKVIAIEENNQEIKKCEDIPKEEMDLIIRYFGVHHKIKMIDDEKMAEEYVERHKK